MTLREEIILRSGILSEADEDVLANLQNFRRDMERHRFSEKFENDAVSAMLNNEKEILPALISKAKQWKYYLGGLIELIEKEQERLSEKIEEVKKETE